MTSPATALALTLLVLPALSCGGGAPPSEGERVSLLARAPDGLIEEPGLLVPDPREQWRDLGGRGWTGHTYSLEKGRRLAVWTRRARATLALPAIGPGPRDLVLTLGAPGLAPEPLPVQLRIELNGLPIGQVEVEEPFRELRLQPPADAWRRGENELALVVDHLRPHADGQTYGVALSRVEWGEPRRPVLGLPGPEAALPSGTALVYRIEQRTPGRGLIAGHAAAAGTLRITTRQVDLASGEARAPGSSRTVELPAGELSLPFALPDAGLVELELSWSESEAPLELRELSIEESRALARPPIVLVCLDTMAARNLSLYGYERETTPCLERLARESVVFDRCVTNAPWTMPSVFSFMTGLYPSSHRLPPLPSRKVPPQPWEKWYLAPNRWTLAESLRASGYRTAGFVEHLWLTPRYGFPQGFDRYDYSACEIDKTDPSGGLRYVSRLASDWIAADPDAPFFLFLHAYDIHGPYSPSAPWKGRLRDDPLAERDRMLPSGALHNVYGAVPAYISEAEYEEPPRQVSSARIRSAYDEGVLETDAVLGAWLQDLRDRGILDRVVLVVTADHGETMDRGPYYFGHGVLEEPVLHVPLLIRLPGGEHGGRRVSTPVQLVDLYPTLLELAGIDPTDRPLHGRSLTAALRGAPLEPRPLYSETGIMQQAAIEVDGWRLSLRSPGLDSADEVLLSYPGVPRDWLAAHFPAVLTEPMGAELLGRLREDPDYGRAITELRSMLSSPEVELHPVKAPYGPDESGRRQRKVRRLRAMLAEQARRSQVAREAARPKVDAVHLAPQDVQALGKLGYADHQD